MLNSINFCGSNPTNPNLVKVFTKVGNEIRECGLAPKGTLIKELPNCKPAHVYLSPDATLKDAEKAFEAMG